MKPKPLNLEGDITKYDAYQETTTVDLQRCRHKNTKIEGNTLTCKDCSAGWQGPRIHELKNVL